MKESGPGSKYLEHPSDYMSQGCHYRIHGPLHAPGRESFGKSVLRCRGFSVKRRTSSFALGHLEHTYGMTLGIA